MSFHYKKAHNTATEPTIDIVKLAAYTTLIAILITGELLISSEIFFTQESNRGPFVLRCPPMTAASPSQTDPDKSFKKRRSHLPITNSPQRIRAFQEPNHRRPKPFGAAVPTGRESAGPPSRYLCEQPPPPRCSLLARPLQVLPQPEFKIFRTLRSLLEAHKLRHTCIKQYSRIGHGGSVTQSYPPAASDNPPTRKPGHR